jgi:hypothetical protein
LTFVGSDAGDAATDSTVVVGTDAADGYAATVLSDRPIAYYRFDETSGSTAHDASGNGNDATIGTGVTWGAPGAIAGDANTAIHVAEGSAGVDVGERFDFVGRAQRTLTQPRNPTFVAGADAGLQASSGAQSESRQQTVMHVPLQYRDAHSTLSVHDSPAAFPPSPRHHLIRDWSWVATL